MSNFKFELGSMVKDKVTGFSGKIVGRTEWLYGCLRYSVQSVELKDGRPADAVGFDEDALEVVVAAPPHPMKKTGGPGRTATDRRSEVRR